MKTEQTTDNIMSSTQREEQKQAEIDGEAAMEEID